MYPTTPMLQILCIVKNFITIEYYILKRRAYEFLYECPDATTKSHKVTLSREKTKQSLTEGGFKLIEPVPVDEDAICMVSLVCSQWIGMRLRS